MTTASLMTALALLSATELPAAQVEPSSTDPAIASLAVPSNQLADARKYFVLHKPGVSLEEAEADLSWCWRFLASGAQRPVPGFVPWQKATAPKPIDHTLMQYGLVGSAIGALISGPLERSKRQSRIIRCMVPRGYARYRTSEAIWKQLNTDDAARSIRMQAQIAAGQTPPTPQVLP